MKQEFVYDLNSTGEFQEKLIKPIVLSNNNTKLCNMFSYYPQLIIIIYYACYTLYILFKIEISFKGYLSLHQYNW